MTRIVLGDDHPVVRKGLRAILEGEPDLEVVAEASDGLQTVRLVERLKPDVLLVDLMMPGMNGLEVARQVTTRSPGTRIVLLSMHATEGYVMEALRSGAAGYVLKDASADDLVQAIRTVVSGRRYLSPVLSERAVDAYAQKATEAGPAKHEMLTGREREVLQLVAEGHTSSEIGARLALSPRTVETHRASLMRKLGLRTQTDLIRYALRHAILPGK
jgi:DNA-binding NarL/FixJ family response regulator